MSGAHAWSACCVCVCGMVGYTSVRLSVCYYPLCLSCMTNMMCLQISRTPSQLTFHNDDDDPGESIDRSSTQTQQQQQQAQAADHKQTSLAAVVIHVNNDTTSQQHHEVNFL